MWRVEEAGGIPVILPLSQQGRHWPIMLKLFDGFLFPAATILTLYFYGEERRRPAARSARSAMRWNADCFLWCLQRKNLCWGSAGCAAVQCHAGRTLYQTFHRMSQRCGEHHETPPYDKAAHTVLSGNRIPRCSLRSGRSRFRKQLSSPGD